MPDDHTLAELRGMDEDTARQTLTVAEYERWEQLQELYDEAEETEQRFAAEDEQVAEITVSADPEALGTEVDVYGNDLLVRVDPEDDAVQAIAESMDSEFPDVEGEDVPELDAERADDLAEHLLELLDCIILRWDGVAWDGLPEDYRRDRLDTAREAWGLDGLYLAYVDIMAAIEADRDERVSTVESFRGEERRGRR